MNWNTLYKAWRRLYTANVQLALDDRPPVLVYQMGKVGSSSVKDSLWAHGVGPVLHMHWFRPWREQDAAALPLEEQQRHAVAREIAQEKRAYERFSYRQKIRSLVLEKGYYEVIYEDVIKKRRGARFITNVRDPVSTNVSMFFQSFQEYAGAQFEEADYSTADLIDIFKNDYIFSWPLTWFDKEMKPTLGVDVYDHAFPKEKGHQTLENGPYEILLLKCELGDAAKEKAISEFLGLEDFEITRRNESKDKSYAAQYQQFKDALSVSKERLDMLCDSKYATHFYTPRELEKVRARWAA
jgi:hypothetical protein